MQDPPWEVTASGTAAAVDWQSLKREILSKLDLAAEYRALGVEFARPTPNAKGILECHAVGRRDEVPSAMVNVRTGVYHDSGGSGESLSFWDFALEYGPAFGRHIDVLRYYGARAGVEVPTPRYRSGGRIPESTYLYRDERGEVLFGVFRSRHPNGKKSFSQHPPDGRGGWRHGPGCMDGVRLVPYRLPELLAADPAEVAWVVEGEKDADRLASLGFVASCNPMGAGKWRPEYSAHFRGRPVVVVADNDPAGLKHAVAVCAAMHGVAASVKLLELPGLPPKGDASDWLDAGGTAEELGTLAYAAPEWGPEAEATGPAGDGAEDGSLPPDDEVITVRLSDVVESRVDWLIPGRIPFGKLTLLAGMQKLGKSFVTIDLAARVSTGGEVPGSPGECVPCGSVILLSAEDDLDDTVKPRLRLAGADTGKIHALTTIKLGEGHYGPFNLSYIPHLERAVVRQGDTRLVIIDPVTQYVGSRIDDNKVTQLRALLGPLREMASRLKVAVVIVTHVNKGASASALNRVLGSGGYTALARANWMVFKDPDDRKRRLLLNAGNNLAEDPKGLAYRVVGGAVEWEDDPIDEDADEFLARVSGGSGSGEGRRGGSKAAEATDWLANLFGDTPEVPSEEILKQGEARGFSRSTLWDAKKSLGIRAAKSREHNGAWIWIRPRESGASNASTTSNPSNGSMAHANGAGGDVAT